MNEIKSAYSIRVLPTRENTLVERTGKFLFESTYTTWFAFFVHHTAARVPVSSSSILLGFDDTIFEFAGNNGIVRIGNSVQNAICSVRRGRASSVIEARGLINLLGIRFITLRCKEIEEHMGSTGKYGNLSTGIGVFKLGGANEISNLRFDFVSLIESPSTRSGNSPK
jgi:hypothetical protein